MEQLAEIYLQRGGDIEILGSLQAPINAKSTAPEVVQATQQLLRRVDRLEENEEFNAETFTELLNRIEQLEQIPKTKKQSTQDLLTRRAGNRFFQMVAKAPYNNSKKGQAFIRKSSQR